MSSVGGNKVRKAVSSPTPATPVVHSCELPGSRDARKRGDRRKGGRLTTDLRRQREQMQDALDSIDIDVLNASRALILIANIIEEGPALFMELCPSPLMGVVIGVMRITTLLHKSEDLVDLNEPVEEEHGNCVSPIGTDASPGSLSSDSPPLPYVGVVECLPVRRLVPGAMHGPIFAILSTRMVAYYY